MKNIKGQSLFEVVVALAMATLIVVSVVVLATLSIKSSTFSKAKTMAARYGQETIEWLRGQRDNNWKTFTEMTLASTRCMVTLDDWGTIGPCSEDQVITGTKFQREVKFPVNEDGIEARVFVSWNDSSGFHQTQTSTIFTDWRSQ